MKNQNSRFIMQLIMGAAGGIGALFILQSVDMDGIFGRSLLMHLAALFAVFLATGWLQTILHELGHFVFGKLSGFEFVSFRIGRLMLVFENGRPALKYYTVVGTGGQCLMMPPPLSEKTNFLLYNLGGVLMNLIFGGAGLYLCFRFPEDSFARLIFAGIFVTGLIFALTNGIPFETGGVSNDGSNALFVAKDKNARRSFWLQLYINGLLQKGERYKNMPAEWFSLPKGADAENPMTLQNGVLLYNYQFDSHDFAAAEETAVYLTHIPAMLAISKNELLCELLFLKILRKAPPEEIDALMTPALRKYIQATNIYVSRRRLMYAYQLLYKNDVYAAEKAIADFEETAKHFPQSAEVESEREIIEIVKKSA